MVRGGVVLQHELMLRHRPDHEPHAHKVGGSMSSQRCLWSEKHQKLHARLTAMFAWLFAGRSEALHSVHDLCSCAVEVL